MPVFFNFGSFFNGYSLFLCSQNLLSLLRLYNSLVVAIFVLVAWNLGHRVLNNWSMFAIFNAKNSEFIWTVLPLVYMLLLCMPRYWYIYEPSPISFDGTGCAIVVPTGERPLVLCGGLVPPFEGPHLGCARVFMSLGPSIAHQSINSVFFPAHFPAPRVLDFESACFSVGTENTVVGWRGDLRLSDLVPGHNIHPAEIENLPPFPPAPPVPPVPPAPPGFQGRTGIRLIRPPRNN